MGQQEVYAFLKEHQRQWYTAKDISVVIGINAATVKVNMNKLLKYPGFYMRKNVSGRRDLILFKEDGEDELQQEAVRE